MQKLSERSLQLEKRSLDEEDIQVTCTPTFPQSTSEQEDCMVAKARSLRCRFLPCPETTSPILSPTSPDTSPKARSTLIEDYTGKESIHQSTQHPLSRD